MDISVSEQAAVDKTTSYVKSLKIITLWDKIIWSLLLSGAGLRLFHFFQNRSFWSDEIYLAVSFLKLDFLELVTQQLEFQQKAPVGYLWMVELSVVLFGNSEMAFRLFPLLCGVASLPLFVVVARFFLKPVTIALAIGILAFSPHLVYHSVEAKQYSTEMLSTILALYLYIRYFKKRDLKSLLLWAMWGALLLWFAYSSIFILAGMAAGISLFHLIKRDWKSFFLQLIPFVIWMLSFLANYLFLTYRYSDSGWLVLWFQNREGFMPSALVPALSWLAKKSFALLNFPLGLSWFSLPKSLETNIALLVLVRAAIIPFILLFAGIYASFRSNLKLCMILVFPVALHLVASFLLVYPFYERLTVYLAPLLILLIALGCDRVLDLLESRNRNRQHNLRRALQYLRPEDHSYSQPQRRLVSLNKWALVLTFLLLFGPVLHSAKGVIEPDYFGYHKHWHQRELYQYINKNYRPGDAVYVYHNAIVPYQYYDILYSYKYRAITGRDHRFSSGSMTEYFSKLQSDINNLRKSYKRVWVVHNTNFPTKIGELDDEPYYYYKDLKLNLEKRRQVFNSIGRQVDSYLTKENIHLYLYEVK